MGKNQFKIGFWAAISASILIFPCAASFAFAFGTINSMNQHAEHGKITRVALACDVGEDNDKCFEPKTLQSLSGSPNRFGAVGYPDVPSPIEWPPGFQLDVNEAHCSGGDYVPVSNPDLPYPQTLDKAQRKLEACRARMQNLLDLAVNDANGLVDENGNILGPIPTFGTFDGCEDRPPNWPKCKVLFSFGILLHAAQDFYSHANWVDIASGPLSVENPPGLEMNHRAEWLDLRYNSPFPQGLISGCYEGEPEYYHCEHRVRHMDLNKDTAMSDSDFTENPFHVGDGRTPRGAHDDNFARAVMAAIEETEDKWATLREALIHRYGQTRGAKMICVITRDDPESAC